MQTKRRLKKLGKWLRMQWNANIWQSICIRLPLFGSFYFLFIKLFEQHNWGQVSLAVRVSFNCLFGLGCLCFFFNSKRYKRQRMTKSHARQILEEYVKLHPFPIVDAIVWSYTDEKYNVIQWTFVGLLKVAYGLWKRKPLFSYTTST